MRPKLTNKTLVTVDKRKLRRQKRKAVKLGEVANKHVDRHFVNRVHSLTQSKRFVAVWIGLLSIISFLIVGQIRDLKIFYTQVVSAQGGTYVEGVVGPLTNVNPLFTTSSTDEAASRLLFSGLMRYDTKNHLVTDLAQIIEADDNAKTFTVKLHAGLKWHDGADLDADDVVYTVNAIKDRDTDSHLFSSMDGVKVTRKGPLEVVFELPGSYSPFPHLLTFGIVPEHILSKYSNSQLRGLAFNSVEPIGSGPFKFSRLVNISGRDRQDRELKLQLQAFSDYHLEAPRLGGFTLWVVPTQARLTDLFNQGQLDGAYGISSSDISRQDYKTNVFTDTSAIYLFLKNTNNILKEVEVRRALTEMIDLPELLRELNRPARQVSGPLLQEHLGYQFGSQLPYNPAAAGRRLTKAGWKLVDGIYEKDGQRLEFELTYVEDDDYQAIAQGLAEQYLRQGVQINLDSRPVDGFAENVLQNHIYNGMLLHGINIGADPDVYAFWHSTQASRNSVVRLNLSEYSQDDADEALEAGRSRVDDDTRATKYQTFADIWKQDAPAVGIYRPQTEYYILEGVVGPSGNTINNANDRYRDIHQWSVAKQRVDL